MQFERRVADAAAVVQGHQHVEQVQIQLAHIGYRPGLGGSIRFMDRDNTPDRVAG